MILTEIIKEIEQNINKNSINGSFNVGEFGFFYKIICEKNYLKELNGYKIIKKYYKVPELIYNEKNNTSGILLYRYKREIDINKGLLVDYFAENDIIDKTYIEILENYKKVFNKTIKKKKTNNVDVFFKDRIKSRINKFYNKKFLDKIDNKEIKFNNINVNLNICEIIKYIKKYFISKNKKEFVVISQCDPNDMNICIDGTIFDFLCGGYTPLMAEFATFIWYNLAQGERLSLVYNKDSFRNHSNIYNKILNVHKVDTNIYIYDINKIRKQAINLYIDIIIKPIINKKKYHDWYDDFKNYISMKILAVFDINEMEEEDQYLSLAYLSLIYNNDFRDIDDFKEFLNKII